MPNRNISYKNSKKKVEMPRAELEQLLKDNALQEADFYKSDTFDFDGVNKDKDKLKFYDAYELDERTQPVMLSNELLSEVSDDLINSAKKYADSLTSKLSIYAIEREVTTDTLAFYLPFHLYEDDWGIYIPMIGLLKATEQISKEGINSRIAFKLALEGLIQHELFHYLAELAILDAEKMRKEGFYIIRESLEKNIEEKLAEAFKLRHFKKNNCEYLDQLKEIVKNCGLPGYEDGVNAIEDNDFESCIEKLIEPTIINSIAVVETNLITDFRCPIYLINDDTTGNVSINTLYNMLVEKIYPSVEKNDGIQFQRKIINKEIEIPDTQDEMGKFSGRSKYFKLLYRSSDLAVIAQAELMTETPSTSKETLKRGKSL